MTDGAAANQHTIDRITARLAAVRAQWYALREAEGRQRNEIGTGTDPRSVPRDTIRVAAAAETGTAHAGDRAADTGSSAVPHVEVGTSAGVGADTAASPPVDPVAVGSERRTVAAESGTHDAATAEEIEARRVLALVLAEGGGRDGELGARLAVIRAWFGPDAVETRRAEYAGVRYRLGHAEKLMALFENEPGSGGHARAVTVLAEVRADLETATGNLAAAQRAARDAATSAAADVPDAAAAVAEEIATAHGDPARSAGAGVLDTADAVLREPTGAAARAGGDGGTAAQTVQEALDLAGVAETIDWAARGAAALEATTPLRSPDPADDAVFVAATRRLGPHATAQIAETWRAGAREALAAATTAPAEVGDVTVSATSPDTTPVHGHGDSAPAAAAADTVPTAAADTDAADTVAADTDAPAVGRDFVLGTQVRVPTGARARVAANIAAAELVATLTRQGRAATVDEQAVLAGWSGWGAVAEVFDNRPPVRDRWTQERGRLRELLGEQGFAAARATTLNAHYTDPAVVAVMWAAMTRAGLPDGAVVLEPGCGAGHFVGTAPDTVAMVGVEVEAMSARIAHHLYPSAQVRHHGFERDFAPDALFTGAIGNVPFGRYGIYDPIHNADGHSLHNHFILKSLALTAPGGYVTLLTSAYTSDARRTAARAAIAEYGDLLGAVRLPSGAFDRQAGTQVVTDVLVLRRRDPGAAPTPDTTVWAGEVRTVEVVDAKTQEPDEYPINAYFAQHPDHVLGSLRVGHGMHGRRDLLVHPHTGTPLAEQLRERLDYVVDTAHAHGLGATATAPAGPDADRFRAPGLVTEADPGTGPVLPGVLRFDDATAGFEQFRIGHGWVPVTCRGQDRIAQWRVLVDLGDTVLALTEAGRDPDSTRAERDALRGRLGGLYDGYLSRWGPLNRFTRTEPPPWTPGEVAARFAAAEKRWRITVGRADAVADGRDPDTAEPYDGPLPDPVAEQLQERAARARPSRQSQPHLEGAIARDPRIGMVLALETFRSRYDGTDARTEKAPIFTEDTTPVRVRATHADSPAEAVTLTVDELGHPDPTRIAELLAVPEPEVLDHVGGLIYPALDGSDRWELAQVALSGHVRHKLAAAQALAAEDPHRYRDLVTALENVIPPDVDPARIGARPGAPWVPLPVYRAFLAEEFALDPDTITVDLDRVSGNWKIDTTTASRHRDPSGYPDRYGNARVTGVELMELIANNRAVQVLKTTDELEDAPKPRFHPALTEALRASATALEDRFGQWLWADGDRHIALSRAFNDLHNSFVKPRFTATAPSFSGLNPKYRLYDYQAAAVARFLHTEAVLLDHVVGAGKTLTITVSCMEAKRLGMVRQPWVVVPNHLLAQWSVEVRDAYPNAKLLVAADLDGIEDRQRFVGQTAVTDWDLVIVPQSVFTKIAMTRQAQLDYLEGEVADMARALDEAVAADREFSVKQIEAALKKTRQRIETVLGQKSSDTGLTFEQSGCDFLYVDEAHEYKTLSRPSNSADLSVPDGSQRASDLEIKARYLREQARARNEAEGRPGAPAKALCFATGTPISNTMSEIWVMTKFLRPDLLTDAGLGRIDNWAGTFARPVTNPEMNITATKLRMVTRMSQYANVPQLVAMIDQYRDVVTADQIPVRLPVMAGGVPRNVEFDLGQHTVDFVADLDERLANLSGDSLDQDNTLKIATDGRNAAMYPPLANLPTPAPENSRVEVAADLLWACHRDHADIVIPADKYGPDMTGVFQLVFCDRGTPKSTDTPHSRNVYTELRAALVRRGLPEGQVAFMHEHDTPKKKTALADACRDGRIRVLITSTKKGGTGLNVQRALKQLINMDPAWTAADMEQRIGRIIRQGNTFDTVDVVNLVARRSYDAMMYQYVARKAGFVQQIRREDVPATMEDLGGDFAASWAQTKAAATGDPVFVQQVEADQHVTTLLARRDIVTNTNAARDATITALHRRITAATDTLPGLRADSDRATAWLGTDRARRLWEFPDGRAVPDSEPADLVTALTHQLKAANPVVTRHNTHVTLASIAGIAVTVTYHQQTATYAVALTGATPRYLRRDEMIDVLDHDSAARGLIQKIRNNATIIAERADNLETHIVTWRSELDAARNEPVLVFDQGDELETAKLRAAELRLEVNSRENSPEALAQHARDVERRRAAGQYPNWTLDLNPTPAWADKHHGAHPAAVVATVPQRMQHAADTWAASEHERATAKQNQLWKPLDDTEHEWRYGHDPDTGLPGARTWWAERQWNWEAYDGNDNRETGACDTRQEAINTSTRHVATLARDRDIDITTLDDTSRARPHPDQPAAPASGGAAIGDAITETRHPARAVAAGTDRGSLRSPAQPEQNLRPEPGADLGAEL